MTFLIITLALLAASIGFFLMKPNVGTFLLPLVLLVVGVPVASAYAWYSSAPATATFTVAEKIPAHGNDGKYLINTTDDRTFSVEDSIFKTTYNSTDRYRRLKEGVTYTCETFGVRSHFMSQYRNLISCKEVDKGTPFKLSALPMPSYVVTPTSRRVTVAFTADEAGEYKLDSTNFQLGEDTWGRVRRTVTLHAGEAAVLSYPCAVTRATYGYRLVTPTRVGPTLWAKCR